MLPAEESDSILITMPEVDKRVLIDDGTSVTYHNVLRDKLLELNNEQKAIDLLIMRR